MAQTEYEYYKEQFFHQLEKVPQGGRAFRRECERIQDSLEAEQEYVLKQIEVFTSRTEETLTTEASPHKAARERLNVKQAAFADLLAEIQQQNAFRTRTFNPFRYKPKSLTRGQWRALKSIPFNLGMSAFITILVWVIARTLTRELATDFRMWDFIDIRIDFIEHWVPLPLGILCGGLWFYWRILGARRNG